MTSPKFQKISKALHPDYMANIEAEDFEAHLFYSFKSFLKSSLFEGSNQSEGSKNVTVIRGWCRNWSSLQPQPKNGPGKEHDLILIEGNKKLVILF